ncbi:MAG: hypothetical protein ACTSQE_09540 [Candidatus Heimdallarchaeaceae archaeon]
MGEQELLETFTITEAEKNEYIKRLKSRRQLFRQIRPLIWGVFTSLLLPLLAIGVISGGYFLLVLIFLIATILEVASISNNSIKE